MSDSEDQRKARGDELSLMQERWDVELTRWAMELKDRELRKKADITARQLEKRRDGDRYVYAFEMTNMGPSYAKHIQIWLSDAETDEPVTSLQMGRPLDAKERAVFETATRDDLESKGSPVRLWVKWFDEEEKPNLEPSNATVRL